jgi:Zn-dependent protease
MIEFLVALVGPLISIILAVIFGGVWFLMGGGDSPGEVVLALLAWTNLSLGVFNLIPGYPLDGGRLLRAGIWGLTGDHRKATQIASLLGLLAGGSMLVGGVTLAVLMELINGVWLSIVGAFLFSMARSSFPR